MPTIDTQYLDADTDHVKPSRAAILAMAQKLNCILDGTAPLQPLNGSSIIIGSGSVTPANSNSSFVNNSVITTHADYGFLDDATITFTGASSAYGHASFNDGVKITNSTGFDHHHSYQAYATYNSPGATLANMVSLFSLPHVTAGTVTNLRQIWVSNPVNSGTITNNIGLYFEEMTQGVTSNYAIFIAGNNTDSHFGGGKITLGDAATVYTYLKYDSSSQNLQIVPRPTKAAQVLGTLLSTHAAASDGYMGLVTSTVQTTAIGFNNSGSTNANAIPNNHSYIANLNAYPIAFGSNGALLGTWSTTELLSQVSVRSLHTAGTDKAMTVAHSGVQSTQIGFNNSGSTNAQGVPNNHSYFCCVNAYPLAFSADGNLLGTWSRSGANTHFRITDLPTSASGLTAGTLWNNGGAVSVA